MLQRAVVAILVLGMPFSGQAQQVNPESFVLDNGMEFLLLPRSEQPNSVVVTWVARVGSVNERPGITGISHFFEHMMFKGTRTIGTSDPTADAKFIHDQETTRSALRRLHLTTQYQRWKAGEIDDPWDAANDTPEMEQLRRRLRELMDQQREVTVKDEFDLIYTNGGASGLNAGTTHDMTIYFVTLPANKFELWAWMESDRLNDSVFREFYEERDVVHEERRLRTESTPTGVFQEQFDAMFWQSSPYSWPVIGWTSDLNSYTRQQAEDYFRTYYSPNNLFALVVGDFEPAEVKPTIQRYFGRLERGPEPPPVLTLEMKQLAEKRMHAQGDCQPQVEVRYHGVPFGHVDSFALDVLAEVMNGRTGRLYKSMIEGKRIASSARCNQDNRKYAGAFSFSAECKGDSTPEALESAWYEEVAKLKSEPVTEKELTRVKNNILADSYRSLESTFFLVFRIAMYEAMGGWEFINIAPVKLRAVTADDIMQVANKYFDSTNRSVASYTRREGTAPVDPELASLDPQVRGVAKQMLARFSSINDADQLRTTLATIESRKGDAPPQMQPAIEYVVLKVKERIAELESGNQK